MHASADPEHRLRRVLRANATTSALGGAAAVVAGGPLGELFDVHAWIVRGVGIGLVVFAIDVWLIARVGADRLPTLARLVSVADATWVTATVAVIALGLVPAAGAIVAGAVGLMVADFAVVQFVTARRLDAPVGALQPT